ncbi:hypothetical protein RHODGE_RHODGE_04595 [Rhodoplanes serenus]|uniref:Uncharacterized protein n=1 Tax=Rhodoplanes serenus TaxID=200615 RepID=A0A447D1I0_9BRAD|nr:hypothetical protein [Rhodoplanes serenus]MBI5111541.1 hypothetical protein [Rhodovulum sp.]VCU11384.1 hypothetical protein RHODGE_RHODGE_04595 [Rhodoplanes serenus]
MSGPDRKSYNTVYERLVQRDDDLVGLIAYALYKQHKRDWLVEHRERQGRDPNDDELKAYLTAQQLDRMIQMYRERAETVLNEFGDQILQEATPEIQRAAISAEIATSLAWWRQLPTGIASAFAYSLLLVGLTLVLRFAGVDVLGILTAVGRP